MPILEWQTNYPGQNANPRKCSFKSNDTLASIEAAGYLNPYVNSQGMDVRNDDFFFVIGSDGNQIYKAVINSSGIITLQVGN